MVGLDLKSLATDAGEVLSVVAILWVLILVTWILLRLPKIIEALKQLNDLRDLISHLHEAVQRLLALDVKQKLDELKEGVVSAQKQLV